MELDGCEALRSATQGCRLVLLVATETEAEPLLRAFREPEAQGEPVAAFAIDSHFDIRHSYNPVNGEEYNVIEENTTDRLWYEREYMRVDWSANKINNFSFIYTDLLKTMGFIDVPTLNPASFFIEDPNHPLAPKFEDYEGDGTFAVAVAYGAADYPWSVAVGLVGGATNNITWLLWRKGKLRRRLGDEAMQCVGLPW